MKILVYQGPDGRMPYDYEVHNVLEQYGVEGVEVGYDEHGYTEVQTDNQHAIDILTTVYGGIAEKGAQEA